MGITVDLADGAADSNRNAVATITYRKQGESFRSGFPLSRVSQTRFVGSLFWLEPGTTYDVQVHVSDPDGGPLNGIELSGTASTRAEITIPAAKNRYIVSPNGQGTACNDASPCSLREGIQRAQPGDEVLLRGGVYYDGEIVLPRSGEPGAPIMIRGEAGAIVDGSDPGSFTWTAEGGGVYYTTVATKQIYLVMANDKRLYPYRSMKAFRERRWQLPGYYQDGDRLYVHLENDADPNQAKMVIARYNRGFKVEQNHIYFLDLHFRYYGQGSEAKALYFEDASDNLVQGSVFDSNNGGMAIRGHSHRNVIQGNEFFHSIFDWSWDAVKETKLLERGGIYFGGDPGGRGNVIRRNSFHDSFDGLDPCFSDPTPETSETDVYENEIFRMGDDGIQADGWCSNLRIWDNNFRNVLAGISFAPAAGGPVYAIRNVISEFGAGNNLHSGRSFKFNSNYKVQSGPIYLMHNTASTSLSDFGIKLSSGGSDGWALVYSRNNIWSTQHMALRNDNVEYPVDFDYDILWNGNNERLIRWDDVVYTSLAEFTAATGQEAHAVTIEPALVNPAAGALDPQSPAVDRGERLPGINDNFEGLAPDIGAVELGGDGELDPGAQVPPPGDQRSFIPLIVRP